MGYADRPELLPLGTHSAISQDVLLSVKDRSRTEVPAVRVNQSEISSRSLFSAMRDQSIMSLMQDAAHDLRDVLNVIAMNVELLARAAERSTQTSGHLTAKRSADTVRRELRRLDRQLEVLLSGRMVAQTAPQVVDMTEVVKMLVELIGPRASRQRVTIALTSTGVLRTHGHPDRLHGAILSLMINALDAMPKGGRLDLVLSQIRGVQIEVRDTGPGIPGNAAAAIWAPGYTTKTDRAGLGLHVARSVVESHDGTIRYEPNPSGGSCFVVHLASLHH